MNGAAAGLNGKRRRAGPYSRRERASREIVHNGTASGERASNKEDGTRSSFTSAQPTVAVLVLLPRAARARIGSPDLLPRANERRRHRDGHGGIAAIAVG